MAAQANEPDWNWFTPSRVRILRELELERTEHEAARTLGVAYTTVRGHVAAIKERTGLRTVRHVRQWWRQNRAAWAVWVLAQGGVGLEEYLRYDKDGS
jgi:hypothetical protein